MTMPGAVQKDRGEPAKVRIGVVETVDPLTVRLQETLIPADRIGVIGSYFPVAGEVVALAGQSAVGTSGTSWLVLGAISSLAKIPLMQRITVDSQVASVTFTVPANLGRLSVVWTARSTAAVANTSVDVRFNGDATANYHHERIEAVNAGAATGIVTTGATSWSAGVLAGGSATAGFFSSGQITVAGWDEPHGVSLCFFGQSASTAFNGVANSGGGFLLNSAGPFTSVTLFPGTGNWETGSDFQLEGWPG